LKDTSLYTKVLGITETKLHGETCSNVDIKNYNFFHTDSKTKAGGTALYIANNLKSIPRPDIKFSIEKVESCWAQIDAGKNKSKAFEADSLMRSN
jgi:hypothetical protein